MWLKEEQFKIYFIAENLLNYISRKRDILTNNKYSIFWRFEDDPYNMFRYCFDRCFFWKVNAVNNQIYYICG